MSRFLVTFSATGIYLLTFFCANCLAPALPQNFVLIVGFLPFCLVVAATEEALTRGFFDKARIYEACAAAYPAPFIFGAFHVIDPVRAIDGRISLFAALILGSALAHIVLPRLSFTREEIACFRKTNPRFSPSKGYLILYFAVPPIVEIISQNIFNFLSVSAYELNVLPFIVTSSALAEIYRRHARNGSGCAQPM